MIGRSIVWTGLRRRCDELAAAGREQTHDELVEEIRARDSADSNRAHSPLRQTQDALVVDTTGMTIEDQVGEVVTAVREALDAGKE